jgi:hypothetical protein
VFASVGSDDDLMYMRTMPTPDPQLLSFVPNKPPLARKRALSLSLSLSADHIREMSTSLISLNPSDRARFRRPCSMFQRRMLGSEEVKNDLTHSGRASRSLSQNVRVSRLAHRTFLSSLKERFEAAGRIRNNIDTHSQNTLNMLI